MPRFSIPADFQTSTIEKLSRHNETWEFPVKEVYGSLNPSVFGAGRKASDLKAVTFDKLKTYVQACHDKGIHFNYTLNLSCHSNREFTRKGIGEIIKFTRKLSSIGIHRYTVALPSIIDVLNEHVPAAKVGVSVISSIDSPFKLKTYLSAKNIDRILLPAYLNRNPVFLQKMTSYKEEFGVEFGTIVNSLCFIDCPFRAFHYSSGSHNRSSSMEDYYFARCFQLKLEDPVQILKAPWVRPEDIREYIPLGIDYFKISGREFWNADFIKMVDAYNKGSYAGNLMELLTGFSGGTLGRSFVMQNNDLESFTRPFYDGEIACNGKECETCNYCNHNACLIRVDEGVSRSSKEYFEKQRAVLLGGQKGQLSVLHNALSRSRRKLSRLVSGSQRTTR